MLTTIGDVLLVWVLAAAMVAGAAVGVVLVLGAVAMIATMIGRLWAVVARLPRSRRRGRALARRGADSGADDQGVELALSGGRRARPRPDERRAEPDERPVGSGVSDGRPGQGPSARRGRWVNGG